MTTIWTTSANNGIYDHEASFKKNGFIDWKQTTAASKLAVGDLMLIYRSDKIREIQYLCRIEKVNMSPEECIDDTEFWKNGIKPADQRYYRARLIRKIDGIGLTYNALKAHGLRSNFQNVLRLSSLGEDVESYVLACLNGTESIDDDMAGYPEGAKETIVVNKYERDPRNRKACIDYYGCQCQACGMDFGKMYGPLAEGFIHVHHVVPVSKLDNNYIINPVKDLIPLCPNCHAMVHHLRISVEDLRRQLVTASKNHDLNRER